MRIVDYFRNKSSQRNALEEIMSKNKNNSFWGGNGEPLSFDSLFEDIEEGPLGSVYNKGIDPKQTIINQ